MAFKSSLMKRIPIIWLPQDFNGLEDEEESRDTMLFDNTSSINDIPVTSVDDLPLWRQSEIRKKRFRRRQHRFNEQLRTHRKHVHFSENSSLQTRSEERYGKRTLPHIVRANSGSLKYDSGSKCASSKTFLPKVHHPKQTHPSLLADVLKTSPLHPISLRRQNFEVKVPSQNVYGRHYQLPSIRKPSEEEEEESLDDEL